MISKFCIDLKKKSSQSFDYYCRTSKTKTIYICFQQNVNMKKYSCLGIGKLCYISCWYVFFFLKLNDCDEEEHSIYNPHLKWIERTKMTLGLIFKCFNAFLIKTLYDFNKNKRKKRLAKIYIYIIPFQQCQLNKYCGAYLTRKKFCLSFDKTHFFVCLR